MSNILAALLLCSCMLLGGSSAFGALDNQGNDFILAFNPNYHTPTGIELHLTGSTATTVTVEYPVNAPTFTNTYAVTPGTVTIVTLPNTASQGWVPDTVQNNAVHAYASEEFVAYMVNRALHTSDAALALPVDTMNTEYLVMDYNPRFTGSQFNVYAAYDNTTVTITPSQPIVGHATGIPFDIVLNRGEGYYARSDSTIHTNTLTGSKIVSDRPVGVVNGNGCTQVPTGTPACDHIFEVAQPVQSWGMVSLVGNLPNRTGGTIYRILASEDATAISLDGTVITTLNHGEFHETGLLTGDHTISGDKPIYVTQYMTGDNSPGADRGDPAMGNMIPFEQYLQDYTFSTVGGNQFAENYLTIITEDIDVGSTTLDGTAIPAADFSSIPGSGYSIARISLDQGTHTTSSNGFHGIVIAGYNSYDSYIYPGGAHFGFINPRGDANPPLCSGSILDGSPPVFNGSATDNRPSEDVNDNGVLDAGEDLNSNGVIDTDTGIFFVELQAGSSNLSLSVDAFIPGDGSVSYSASLVDTSIAGNGVVEVTDGVGNICTQSIDLTIQETLVCDADNDGNVDRDDISLIFAARNEPASGPEDPRDADGDGTITVLDGRTCSRQCTAAGCAVL